MNKTSLDKHPFLSNLKRKPEGGKWNTYSASNDVPFHIKVSWTPPHSSFRDICTIFFEISSVVWWALGSISTSYSFRSSLFWESCNVQAGVFSSYCCCTPSISLILLADKYHLEWGLHLATKKGGMSFHTFFPCSREKSVNIIQLYGNFLYDVAPISQIWYLSLILWHFETIWSLMFYCK